jgi:hypothetical protein
LSPRTGAGIHESPGFHRDPFITNFSAVFNLKIIDFRVKIIEQEKTGWEARDTRGKGVPPSLPTGPSPE